MGMIEVHPREIEIDVVSLNGSYSVDAFFSQSSENARVFFKVLKTGRQS